MIEVKFNPFPELVTERLILTQLKSDDAQLLFQLRSDPQVMQYIAKPLMQSTDEALALIEKLNNGIDQSHWIFWSILLREKKQMIGTCCLWNFQLHNHRAELGYELLPEFHRRGFITEAISAVINFAFNELKFHSLEANINPENEASIGVASKLGFVKEAHFKENVFFDGKYRDTAIYSLVKK